jgi:hypothetical protein
MKRSVLLSLTGITLHAFLFLTAVQASSQLRVLPQRGGDFPQKSAGPAVSPSRTWLIRPDGTGDVPTIQAGADSAAAGDTLLLDDGTFTGPGNHDVRLLNEIVIRSRNGPERTVIDCQHAGPAFSLGDWAAEYERGPTLVGVAIVNGGSESGDYRNRHAVVGAGTQVAIDNCVITDGAGHGVYLYTSIATIRNSVIGHCGGAAVSLNNSIVRMTDCAIRDNAACAGGDDGSIDMTRCRIERNSYALSSYGLGARLVDCDIVGNGGFEGSGNSVHVIGSRLYENTGMIARTEWGEYVLLENNVISGHTGALLTVGSHGRADVIGNTIVGGVADEPLFVVGEEECGSTCESQFAMERNVIAFNTGPSILAQESPDELTVAHNDVFANAETSEPFTFQEDGNFSADPWFCNRFAGDYTLQEGSPCLPENNESGELIGALGQGCTALEAALNVTPSVLGGRLQGPMKAKVSFDNGVDVTDIDTATIRLGGILAPETVHSPGGDTKSKLTVEFQKPDVLGLLLPVTPGETRRVYLTAQTRDGRALRASSEVTIGHIAGLPESTAGEEAASQLSTPAIVPGIASVTPNPFNPTTRIRFGVVQEGSIDLTVYDVAGRVVEHLVHETMPAGDHEVTWDAGGIASGVYFARLTTPEGSYTTKLVVMK